MHSNTYFQAYFCTYIGFAESETEAKNQVPETYQIRHWQSVSDENEVDDDSELSDVDEHWDNSAPAEIRMKVQSINKGKITNMYKDHEKVI